MPDRFGLLHVMHMFPWLKGNGQRGYKDSDLPKAREAGAVMKMGKALLAEVGYSEIWNGSFLAKTDSLSLAPMKNGTYIGKFYGILQLKTRAW